MALSNFINDRLAAIMLVAFSQGKEHPDGMPGYYVQEAIVDLLKDPALRGEVWETAKYSMVAEDASIADIHVILDSLVKVFEDPQEPEDPEELSQVDIAVNILME